MTYGSAYFNTCASAEKEENVAGDGKWRAALRAAEINGGMGLIEICGNA